MGTRKMNGTRRLFLKKKVVVHYKPFKAGKNLSLT